MFEPDKNPGYEKLVHDAAALIEKWFQNDWYRAGAEQGAREAEGVAPRGPEA